MLQRLAPLFIFLLLVPIASAQFPIKVFSEKDFFVSLEENTNQCLTDCHAVFRLKNPFGFSIPIGKLLGFRFEGQASKLKQYKVFVEKTVVVQKKKPVYETVLEQVDGNAGGTIAIEKQVFKEWEYYSVEEKKWIEVSEDTELKPNQTVKVKIVGKKEPDASIDWIPSIDFSKDFSTATKVMASIKNLIVEEKEWAWWNANWEKKRALTDLTAAIDLNATTNAIWIKNLDVSGFGLCSDLNDLRVVNETTSTELDCNIMGAYNSTDLNVFCLLDKDLAESTAYNDYYLYYDNAACPAPTRLKFNTSLDGFEDGDWNSEGAGEGKPDWECKDPGDQALVDGQGCVIEESIVKSGDYSVKVVDVDGDPTPIPMLITSVNDISLIDGNVKVFRAWLRATDAQGGCKYDMAPIGIQGAIKDNYIQIYDGGNWQSTGVSASADTWYLFEFFFFDDIRNDKFGVRISQNTEGNYVYKNMNFTYAGSGEVINEIRAGVYNNNFGAVTCYIDDISFDEAYIVSYSVGSEKLNKLDVDYSTTFSNIALDSEKGINTISVDFNELVSYAGIGSSITDKGYRWDFNGTTYSFDENITRSFSSIADYNVCLDANAIIDASYYEGEKCKIVSIKEFPQNVDFNVTPAQPALNQSTRFQASSDSNGVKWFWLFGDGSSASGQDVNHSFTTTNDFNVCVTASIDLTQPDGSNVDLNRQLCQTVSVYGKLKAQFYDENTFEKLVPTTLTVDGIDHSADVNADGVLNLNLAGHSSGYHTIVAGLNDYTARTFVFDWNQYSVIEENLALLKTDKGGEIAFKFYDTDETTVLENALVEVRTQDVNIAEAKLTNVFGEVSFFLNPDDENYFFHITKSDETTLDYYQAVVTVKVPKDEETLQDLTSEVFHVQLGGVASRSYADNSTDLSFKILTNASYYYQAQVDYNSAEYLSRTYSFKAIGDTSSIEIQPYLPKTADAATIYVYVVDSLNQRPIEDVLVEVTRTGGVLAGKTIEQEHTDSSGAAVLSMLINEQYELRFYYENELVYTSSIVPTSTTYTVKLDITTLSYTELVVTKTVVEFNPSGGTVEEIDGNISFDVNVFNHVGLIQDINVNVFQNGVVIANKHGSGLDGNFFSFTISSTEYDANSFISVDVNITLTTGFTEHYSIIYSIKTPYSYNLLENLRDIKDDIGGDLAANFIAFLITLFVVAGLGTKLTTSFEALFGIAAAVMFFFVYIGWVNPILYSIALIGGIASFIVVRRFG